MQISSIISTGASAPDSNNIQQPSKPNSMKKQQLEQLIEEQKAYIAKLQQQFANLDNNLSNSQQHVNELQQEIAIAKDNASPATKGWVKQYLKDNLHIEIETNWGGSITVKLLLENSLIDLQTESITTMHNPLDE